MSADNLLVSIIRNIWRGLSTRKKPSANHAEGRNSEEMNGYLLVFESSTTIAETWSLDGGPVSAASEELSHVLASRERWEVPPNICVTDPSLPLQRKISRISLLSPGNSILRHSSPLPLLLSGTTRIICSSVAVV